MAFQLQIDEPVGKSIKLLVRKQIDKALNALRLSDNLDEAIHDVRRSFKKVRALLRLVRDELGDQIYRDENRCFRDAARPLTEIRDAAVLVDTLDKLIGQVDADEFASTREALMAEKTAVCERALERTDAIGAVTAAIESARARASDWPIAHRGWDALEPGLKRVYRRGCRAFAAAFANPSMENTHECRKQVKYIWHHLQVLKPLWDSRMKKLRDHVRQLSDLLGDDHDLAVLRQKVDGDPTRFGGEGAVSTLTALIDRRRVKLQQDAFQFAQRVYCDKPSSFTARVKCYWKSRPKGARVKSAPKG
jgi:CHAD domain-containing protein